MERRANKGDWDKREGNSTKDQMRGEDKEQVSSTKPGVLKDLVESPFLEPLDILGGVMVRHS